jgi:membrane fusion protein (multidrug efflux system)
VAADTALITLVPLRDVWAVANYREEQLTKMRVGQPAKITVDAFPGVVFHGWVDSLEPASEARGALMPPDRAVGNFTKIVQRVPVKIRLDRTAPEKGGDTRFAWANGRLVPGLSVETVVDTRFMPASVAASGAPSGAAAGVDGAP